jgi:hypothetical protein
MFLFLNERKWAKSGHPFNEGYHNKMTVGLQNAVSQDEIGQRMLHISTSFVCPTAFDARNPARENSTKI